MAGPGFAQQAVEVFGMPGVNQHIHGHLLAQFGERTADFKVPQVGAYQHLPAFAAQLIAQQRGVNDFDVFDLETAIPYIELVEQGVGKRHELPEYPPASRAQLALLAPVGQALLVLPDAASCAAAEHKEVQHNGVKHRAEHTSAQQPDAQGGELHQPETAALFVGSPMLLRFIHALQRLQRMPGKRINMPKNSLVCMLEISALSWNRRKCERPSCG